MRWNFGGKVYVNSKNQTEVCENVLETDILAQFSTESLEMQSFHEKTDVLFQ